MSRDSRSSASAGGGIGFFGVLTVAFIVLKLLGKITWSWFWVLSPLWISVILFIFIVVLSVIFIKRF